MAAAQAGPAEAPPSALGFEVSPTPEAWRWRFVLSNRGSVPLPVVADRRLVWLEILPPPPAPGARPARRRPRVARCVHDARPATNERAPEVVLNPGQRHAETFDLRDQCNLRIPNCLVPGAQLVVHYGYPQARRARPRPSRSLVRDEGPTVVNDLTTTVQVPALPASLVPAESHGVHGPEAAVGAPSLEVSVRTGRAATGAGLGVSVSVRNPSVHPVWALWRPTVFGFEVVGPTGRRVLCEEITRQPGAHLEHFVRFGGRSRRGMSLMLAQYCPLETFDVPGIYLVRGRYTSRADGEGYGFGRVFVGEVGSAQSVARISRGRGPYVPLDPERLR